MNILISGGAGFIGSYVKDLLSKKQHTIFILDNLTSGDERNIEGTDHFIRGNIEDDKAYEALDSYEFDIIIHLAAQTSVPKSLEDPINDMRVNIEGTLKILGFAKRKKVKKFIFSSTAAVYGDNKMLPITEDHNPNPSAPYGVSKLSSEYYIQALCKENDIDYVVLRFSNVYGPKQTKDGEGGVIKVFFDSLQNNQAPIIYGDGCQTRDFIFVEDLANAHLFALDAKSGVYNVSSNTEITIKELYQKMTEIMLKTEVAPLYKGERDGDIYRSCLSNSKLKHATGWEPETSIDAGLAKTLQSTMKKTP
jgi:UDP-glucose 4-epimerase